MISCDYFAIQNHKYAVRPNLQNLIVLVLCKLKPILAELLFDDFLGQPLEKRETLDEKRHELFCPWFFGQPD